MVKRARGRKNRAARAKLKRLREMKRLQAFADQVRIRRAEDERQQMTRDKIRNLSRYDSGHVAYYRAKYAGAPKSVLERMKARMPSKKFNVYADPRRIYAQPDYYLY